MNDTKKKLLTKTELIARLEELKDRLDSYIVLDVGYAGLSNTVDDMREALDNSRMKAAFEKEQQLRRMIDGHTVELCEHSSSTGREGWKISIDGSPVRVAYDTDIEGAFTVAKNTIED